jgi:hypothetical protein
MLILFDARDRRLGTRDAVFTSGHPGAWPHRAGVPWTVVFHWLPGTGYTAHGSASGRSATERRTRDSAAQADACSAYRSVLGEVIRDGTRGTDGGPLEYTGPAAR